MVSLLLISSQVIYSSPLNILVDVVIRHWLNVLAEEASGSEGFDHPVQHMDSLFYSDDGLIVSTQTEWIKLEFYVLMGIFEHLGMNKNTINTLGMI